MNQAKYRHLKCHYYEQIIEFRQRFQKIFLIDAHLTFKLIKMGDLHTTASEVDGFQVKSEWSLISSG